MYGYDCRQTKAPIFSLKAHDKSCTNLSFSPHIPTMMATISLDEYVKVWDIGANKGTEPKLTGYRKFDRVGELYSL